VDNLPIHNDRGHVLEQELEEIYQKALTGFKNHFRLIRTDWQQLYFIKKLGDDLKAEMPESEGEIQSIRNRTLRKQIALAISRTLATVPLVLIFGMIFTLHHLGFYTAIVFYGSMLGTTAWVFMLDRSSFGWFAAANLVGVFLVGGLCMFLAAQDSSDV